MPRTSPLRYRLVLALSLSANALAIPTMGIVIFDIVEQADWRAEDQAWADDMERRHGERMAELSAIKQVCEG